MIANDYGAIARRAYQLAQDRKAAAFVLPERVTILSPSVVHPHMQFPDCDLCLVFHSTLARFTTLLRSNSEVEITRLRMLDFADYLRPCFPSAHVVSRYEIQLARDDADRFTAYMARFS